MKRREKGKKQTARPSALLEYIESTQQSFQRDIDAAQTPEEQKDWQLSRKITLWEVDAAQKYRLTPSALAMIERLKPAQGNQPLKAVPGTGIWMMLDDEKCSNVYFSSIAHAATSYFETHPSIKRVPSMLDIIIAHPWLWDFQVMAVGEHPLFYLYDAEKGRWTRNKGNALCYTGLCEPLGIDSRGWPGWYICDACKAKLDYWTSWFPVALMALHGDFAETEVPQEPRQIKEREVRTMRRPGGYNERKILHTWHIINFDISVKSQSSHPERGENKSQQPTWLENAIADETVIYVAKHIEQTQRLLQSARYVNMRGKTIDVRSYDKRVPMSVKRLKQSIYRATARKEEETR
jgi:hypothetical protein